MTFTKKLAERALVVFVTALVGVFATGNITGLDDVKALWPAAVAAGVSAVLGLVTRSIGDPDTPSVVSSL